MNKKMIGILVCILFFGASFLPIISGDTGNENKVSNNSYGPLSKTDWWPMFLHDLQHSAYSTSDAPDTNNTIWDYTTTGLILDSSPAVTIGRVYIGSWDNKVYCLNAYDGSLIWSYTTGNGVTSSPAVADGKVYIGSYDNKVYCLDADTGGFIWSYTTGDWIRSSPAVADGKVYIGSIDNKVYCLDADTGGFIWSYTTGHDVISSPAVANGKVYIGSLDYKVYCLDSDTGGFIWSYTTGASVSSSSPAVADGKVYIGSADYKVYCLDSDTGGFIWSYTTGDYVFKSPAVANGKVYIGSYDNKVYCLDADTGGFIWSYTTGDNVDSSPAVADGKVYIGSIDDKVYCLNAYDGSLIWSYTTGNGVESSPAVADGKVYIGSWDNKVYCFGNFENQPPTVDISHPSQGQTVSGTVSITGTADDPDGTVSNVKIKIDSGVWYTASGTTSWSYQWDTTSYSNGQHTISARSYDGEDYSNIDTISVNVDNGENNPPNNPTISGPNKGKPNTEYMFTFRSVDPDGDDVRFHIDWNDGNNEITPYTTSGSNMVVSHTWTGQGTFTITVYAEDEYGAISGTTTSQMIIEKSKTINTPFLNWLHNHPNMFPLLQRLIQRLGLQ